MNYKKARQKKYPQKKQVNLNPLIIVSPQAAREYEKAINAVWAEKGIKFKNSTNE